MAAYTIDSFRIAPGLATPLLNFFLRGVTPTRPGTLYFSLGTSTSVETIDNAVELSGMTRVPYVGARGAAWGHHQSISDYPYQSVGCGGNIRLLRPLRLRVPSGYVGTINSNNKGYIMVFDAAIGGNLLLVIREQTLFWVANNIIEVHAGNTTRSSGRYLSGPYSGDPTYAYVSDMVFDWLFRGYESLTQLFSVSSYPNIQVEFLVGSTNACGAGAYTAIPRNTSNWSAPATGPVALATKCTNQVAILSPLTTLGGSYTANVYVVVRLGPDVGGFSTKLSTNKNVAAQQLFAIGDQFNLPVGSLEVCKA